MTPADCSGKAYETTHGAYGTVWFATLQYRVLLSSPVSLVATVHSRPRCGVPPASPRQHADGQRRSAIGRGLAAGALINSDPRVCRSTGQPECILERVQVPTAIV